MKPIFLLGFMGCGKSTLGKKLASLLNQPFYDLDRIIELELGRTIPDIFENLGETYFRKIERASIASFGSGVVALGGGAFELPENRFVTKKGVSVFLDWPWPLLFKRVGGDPQRPLAQNMLTFRDLHLRRRPSFLSADVRVRFDHSMDDNLNLAISFLLESLKSLVLEDIT